MKVFVLLTGGAIGTLVRYQMSVWIQHSMQHPFPYGILSVNVIGSFLIGFCWSFSESFHLPDPVRLFLFTGFFGGFTTFSTFTLDSMNLVRSGEIKLALLNILLSNLFGIIAVFLGYMIGKYIVTLMK